MKVFIEFGVLTRVEYTHESKSEAATSSDKASLDDQVADSTATISTPYSYQWREPFAAGAP